MQQHILAPNADPALSLFPFEDKEAFASLLAEYDRAIARISASHDALIAKVADLTQEVEQKNRLLARQERLAALGEMAAGVAHEIRNPLGGIALYLDLLRKDLAANEPSLAICSKIGSAVSRLNHIVEAILNFTRSFEPDMQALDTRGLIDEVVEIASPLAGEKHIAVEVDVASDGERVVADGGMLHQLLLNLVRNAIEASPSGSSVRISALAQRQASGRAVVFRIEDRGAGIAPDVMPKLFTPFQTTKKGGTGLGLALCQRIAEAHRGELKAHNLECGAVFELTLPIFE